MPFSTRTYELMHWQRVQCTWLLDFPINAHLMDSTRLTGKRYKSKVRCLARFLSIFLSPPFPSLSLSRSLLNFLSASARPLRCEIVEQKCPAFRVITPIEGHRWQTKPHAYANDKSKNKGDAIGWKWGNWIINWGLIDIDDNILLYRSEINTTGW